MPCKTETSRHILEIGIVGIQLHSILREIRYLSSNASVKDKRQRVDTGIRSRVGYVYLVVLMKTNAKTVHSTIESSRLLSEHTKAILAIRRVCAALGQHSHGSHGHTNSYQ